MVFSERMKEMRLKTGMTQKELADAVGVGQGQISLWENRGNPKADLLPAIARALGTTVDYLVGLLDDPRALTEDERRLIEAYRRRDQNAVDAFFGDKFDALLANDPTTKTAGHSSKA